MNDESSLRLVREGWPVLLVALALGAVGAAVWIQRSPTAYGATSTIVVSPANAFLDPATADKLPVLAATLARIAHTDRVVTAAQSKLQKQGFAMSGSWIRTHTNIQEEAQSPVVQVAATAPSQNLAAAVAGAEAAALARFVSSPPPAMRRGAAVANLLVTKNGKVSPRPLRDALVALSAAFLLGLLGAGLIGSRRRQLRRTYEIVEIAGLPVLATIHKDVSSSETEAGVEEAMVRLSEFRRPDGGVVVCVAAPRKRLAEDTAIKIALAATAVGLHAIVRSLENGQKPNASAVTTWDDLRPLNDVILLPTTIDGVPGHNIFLHAADHVTVIVPLPFPARRAAKIFETLHAARPQDASVIILK